MHGTSKKDFSNFSSVLHNILPFNFTKIFKQKSEYFKTLVYRILFSRNKYVLWKNFLNFLFDHLLFKTNLNQKGFLKEYFQSPYKNNIENTLCFIRKFIYFYVIHCKQSFRLRIEEFLKKIEEKPNILSNKRKMRFQT